MRHLQNAVLWIGTMNENGMEWNGIESNHFYYAVSVVVSVVVIFT